MLQQQSFFEEDPRKLYQRLRDMLPVRPPDHQPPERRLDPALDLHFQTFLEIIHKYSQRLDLKFRATPVGQDVILAFDGVGPASRLYLSPTDQTQTFVLKLRTVFQWGVYKEQIEAFRQLFSLADEREFFHVLPEGRQVSKDPTR